MKKILAALTVVYGAVSIFAVDPSEKGIRTSPLTIYSGGIAAGGLISVNDQLAKDLSNRLLKVTFSNNVYFRNNLSFFLDADWIVSGRSLQNYGADAGFDFLFSDSDFRPFIGMGVGAHYFDHPDQKFGRNIGTSATMHLGISMNVSDNFEFRIRVPYHIVLNDTKDNAAGIEIGFLFSNRFKKVKKLNYNEN
jgi:hypothetical protein